MFLEFVMWVTMFKEKVKDLYGEELPELFVDCVLDKNNSKDVESIKCIEDTRKKLKKIYG